MKTLVVGVCKPAGESGEYNGLYPTQSELEVAAASMPGVPVKAEHAWTNIGSVVSAWIDDGQNLNSLVRLHDDSFPAHIAQGMVRDGIAAHFSLAYSRRKQSEEEGDGGRRRQHKEKEEKEGKEGGPPAPAAREDEGPTGSWVRNSSGADTNILIEVHTHLLTAVAWGARDAKSAEV